MNISKQDGSFLVKLDPETFLVHLKIPGNEEIVMTVEQNEELAATLLGLSDIKIRALRTLMAKDADLERERVMMNRIKKIHERTKD